MGTNYYAVGIDDPDEPGETMAGQLMLHVGKASAGWVFMWHEVTIGEGTALDSTAAWEAFLRGTRAPIVDEYGQGHDFDAFLAMVAARRGEPSQWGGERNPSAGWDGSRYVHPDPETGDDFLTGCWL